jgi:hypothetical protein
VTINLESRRVRARTPSNSLLIKVHGRSPRHGSRSPRVRIEVWRRQVFERVRKRGRLSHSYQFELSKHRLVDIRKPSSLRVAVAPREWDGRLGGGGCTHIGGRDVLIRRGDGGADIDAGDGGVAHAEGVDFFFGVELLLDRRGRDAVGGVRLLLVVVQRLHVRVVQRDVHGWGHVAVGVRLRVGRVAGVAFGPGQRGVREWRRRGGELACVLLREHAAVL